MRGRHSAASSSGNLPCSGGHLGPSAHKKPEELPLEKCSLLNMEFLQISLSINSLVPKWQYGIHPKGYQCCALHFFCCDWQLGHCRWVRKSTEKLFDFEETVRISNRLCYSLLLSMCVPHHSVDSILQFQETSNTVPFWSSELHFLYLFVAEV